MISDNKIQETISILFDRVWNKHETDSILEIFISNPIIHNSETIINSAIDFQNIVINFLTAFPHFHYEMDEIMIDHNKAAVRWHGSGKHENNFYDKPATGKTLSYSGITVFHFNQQGQIAECWVSSNIAEKLNLIFNT